MSHFSHIRPIPLPIRDITNEDVTIHDLNVAIVTKVINFYNNQYGQGPQNEYALTDPETGFVGSLWPVGFSFTELCQLFWKVDYVSWGGNYPDDPSSCSGYINGGYMPSYYPRYSKGLTNGGTCFDYSTKGNLYYAVRAINYDTYAAYRHNCDFYDGIKMGELGGYLRTFTVKNPIDMNTCGPNNDLFPQGYYATFDLFAHPYAFLNQPFWGGTGEVSDLLKDFPCIVKVGNLYYPHLILDGFSWCGSISGQAFDRNLILTPL
jgi:hypothetical protein